MSGAGLTSARLVAGKYRVPARFSGLSEVREITLRGRAGRDVVSVGPHQLSEDIVIGDAPLRRSLCRVGMVDDPPFLARPLHCLKHEA